MGKIVRRVREIDLSIRIKYAIHIIGKYPNRKTVPEIQELIGLKTDTNPKIGDIIDALLRQMILDSGDFIEDLDAAREEAKSKY